ncbi:hypothetical protein ACWOFR_09515 [Carnobacterium gallinarum]|nr:hypothetical protein [Carnobacterium gallinarum]
MGKQKSFTENLIESVVAKAPSYAKNVKTNPKKKTNSSKESIKLN